MKQHAGMFVKMCESDHDQEQTSVLAEWAWQEEYNKVWEIQLHVQGIYSMTR